MNLRKSSDIDIHAPLYKNRELITNDMDDETVMMSIDSGKYYGLNRIGSHIWSLLEEPRCPEEIITLLTKKYNVPDEQCRIEVMDFIKKMLELKLLKQE